MITVPTIGVFVPRSDVLYACSGMMLAWVTIAAILAEHRTMRWLLAVLSGIALFGCLLLSLAHVPVLVMLSVFAAGFVDCGLETPHRFSTGNHTRGAASFFIAVRNLATWDALQPAPRMAHESRKSRGILLTIRSHVVRHGSSSIRWNSRWLSVCQWQHGHRHARAGHQRAILTSNLKNLTNGHLFAFACALTWTLCGCPEKTWAKPLACGVS